MLGIVWSPCVGPTLGAAIGLASQGRELGSIVLVMMSFGIGATIPLIVIGMLSRTALMRARGGLLRSGRAGKAALGAILVASAIGMVSGANHRAEGWLVDHSPAWLVQLTSRY